MQTTFESPWINISKILPLQPIAARFWIAILARGCNSPKIFQCSTLQSTNVSFFLFGLGVVPHRYFGKKCTSTKILLLPPIAAGAYFAIWARMSFFNFRGVGKTVIPQKSSRCSIFQPTLSSLFCPWSSCSKVFTLRRNSLLLHRTSGQGSIPKKAIGCSSLQPNLNRSFIQGL